DVAIAAVLDDAPGEHVALRRARRRLDPEAGHRLEQVGSALRRLPAQVLGLERRDRDARFVLRPLRRSGAGDDDLLHRKRRHFFVLDRLSEARERNQKGERQMTGETAQHCDLLVARPPQRPRGPYACLAGCVVLQSTCHSRARRSVALRAGLGLPGRCSPTPRGASRSGRSRPRAAPGRRRRAPRPVRGTPSVFAADGTLLGGYLPPDTLLEQLELLAE